MKYTDISVNQSNNKSMYYNNRKQITTFSHIRGEKGGEDFKEKKIILIDKIHLTFQRIKTTIKVYLVFFTLFLKSVFGNCM